MEFAAKAIYVFDTVRHVLAIFPHAGEGRIANRARPPRGRFYGYVHLNNRALLDRYVLEGSEDAILVFCGDSQCSCPQYTPSRAPLRRTQKWAYRTSFERLGR